MGLGLGLGRGAILADGSRCRALGDSGRGRDGETGFGIFVVGSGIGGVLGSLFLPLSALGTCLGSVANLAEKVGQDVGGSNSYIRVGIAEILEETVEERGEVADELEIRERVEDSDPADEVVACKGADDVHALGEEGHEAGEGEDAIGGGCLRVGMGSVSLLSCYVEFSIATAETSKSILPCSDVGDVLELGDIVGGSLAHNVLEESVEELCAILDGEFRVGGKLGEGIKDLVKVDEDFALADLGNVVEAFAGKVPDLAVWVGEAGEDGFGDLFEVWGDLETEGDADASETNEATVAGVEVLGTCSEKRTELLYDEIYTSAVAPGEAVSDLAFEV